MRRMKPDSFVKKDYKATSCWQGDHYSKNSDWQFTAASKALDYLKIPANANILDIGCGDGRFTKHLANLALDGKVIGLDPSLSMLATAHTNIASNLSFIQGDVLSLPFENQFDRIVAFNSLHWVSEITVALEQIRKALLPGGQVLILVAPIQTKHLTLRIIDAVAKRECWNSHFDNTSSVFSFYTPAEWGCLIENTGMILECLQVIDASLDYPDKKAFADFIAGWIPFGTIPENKRREYVKDVVDAYIAAIPCDPNGVIHYRMDELVIMASKTETH